MKRKIAAILAADVAEYSRLVAEDEEQAVRQLVASIEVFKASIETHGGRIFNTAGDAVLAEFQSAVEAVRSAIDIQETLCARSEAHAPHRRMMFRMGISIGDVVENGSDLLGDGVNIAARLQTLSQPGGVAISRWVQEQVAGKVGREFRDTGYQLVKNMPAPIHVFQSSIAAPVPTQRKSPPSASPVPAPAPGASRRRLGVLAAGVAAVAVAAAVAFFVLMRPESAPVAIQESPPAAAKQDAPAPLPTAVRQIPQRPAGTPAPSPAYVTPEEAFAPREQRPSVQQSPPAAESPQPTPAPAPVSPKQASAPDRGGAGVLRSDPQPAIAPSPAFAPAPDAATDSRQQKIRCAQIVERAQLGDLTADDRAFLRNQCP